MLRPRINSQTPASASSGATLQLTHVARAFSSPGAGYFLPAVFRFAVFFFAAALGEELVFFAGVFPALLPLAVLRAGAFFAGAAFLAALFVVLLFLAALFAAGFFAPPLLAGALAVVFFAAGALFFAALLTAGFAVREVPLLFAALLPEPLAVLAAPARVGSFLRLALAISLNSLVLIDSTICLDAPLREALLFSPRFAERAAPAAICCFLDFAGIFPVRGPSGNWPFTHLSTILNGAACKLPTSAGFPPSADAETLGLPLVADGCFHPQPVGQSVARDAQSVDLHAFSVAIEGLNRGMKRKNRGASRENRGARRKLCEHPRFHRLHSG